MDLGVELTTLMDFADFVGQKRALDLYMHSLLKGITKSLWVVLKFLFLLSFINNIEIYHQWERVLGPCRQSRD